MSTHSLSRRQFLHASALLAGSALIPTTAGFGAEKRTAVDQVSLGKTGLKLSRLGLGAGSNSGNVQRSLGREGFNRLVRHALDQGITYIDTAQSYQTHDWVREAVKGVPREKLFIQTKMSGSPEKPLEVIDRFRKELNTDYIDSLLLHCMTKNSWHVDMRRVMDAFEEAKEKKIIRAHGLSCHGLPALTRSSQVDWVDVHLVRINPQAKHIDGASSNWNEPGTDLQPVIKEVKAMRDKGHGIIGMKIIGNGDFKNPEDREKSIRFAMQCGLLDAVVIGFASPKEVDEAIERMNRALATA